MLWFEVRRNEAGTGGRREGPPPARRRSVGIRVREGNRQGCFTTEDGAVAELRDAVRQAMAQARVAPPSAVAGQPPADEPLAATAGLFDPEVEALEPQAAVARLQKLVSRADRARLVWAVHRAVFVSSRGLARQATATGLSLAVRLGRGPAAGFAQGTARGFAALSADAIVERAARRVAAGEAAGMPPAADAPLLLAPEAAAGLVGCLAAGLSARAFEAGRIFRRQDPGREVLSAQVTLRDDGTSPHGLPFPFDALGRARRPVVHVASGRLLTPAVDAQLAAAAALPETAQALGFDEAGPRNLFLEPGAAGAADLLTAADGGRWIGGLDDLGPSGLDGGRFRALARGVRPIEAGALGRPQPPLVWEDDLLRVFREVLARGAEPVAVAVDRELFGAASAPALAVAGGGSWRPGLVEGG